MEDDYSAYCLDQAVMVFCTMVQAKIDAVPEQKGKNAADKRERKQNAVLAKYLQIEDTQAPQKFRDPAEMFQGK